MSTHCPKGVGIMIAGGACPATSLVGHEVIQSHHRIGDRVYILRNGLNALLDGTTPEPIMGRKESYVGDLIGEASRDFVGEENAARCADSLSALQKEFGIGLVHVVGGDGTAAGLNSIIQAYGADAPSISLAPKTIDGDVRHTDTTIGHATAIAEVDRQMHAFRHDSLKMNRALFVQVPGRDAGHLALRGGEGHADIILIKERPYKVEEVTRRTKEIYEQQGYCVVSVAEGFEPVDVDPSNIKSADANGNNGSSAVARFLAACTKQYMWDSIKEADAAGKKPVNSLIIPSEALRGAQPVQEDKELATDLGVHMFEYSQKVEDPYHLAFTVQDNNFIPVPLETIAAGIKTVPEQDYREGMYINHHKQPLV